MDWAVILAGGSGTRFWPLSSPTRPKQLLPLAGSRSTAEETLDRLAGIVPPERVLAVTGAAAAKPLAERLHLPFENLLVEPRPASTGPALVWATQEIRRREGGTSTVLAMHADWVVGDAEAFGRAAKSALDAARRHDRLITVGLVPSRPEPGYGYIVPGDRLDQEAQTVSAFIEKPDEPVARDLIAKGALWNSGLFAWTADRLLAEVAAHTPEIAPAAELLDRGDLDGFFAAVTPVSIDFGVLGRSRRVGMVRGRFEWDDVGTWDALARVRSRDASGNVVVGPAALVESSGCVVWSEGTPVVVSGVSDLVVVSANDRVLVMPRAQAADLKRILEQLPPAIRALPE
ncbi:MAG: mannose-1-phosphate guanylyltransferase [Gemmatimonadales bacterium]